MVVGSTRRRAIFILSLSSIVLISLSPAGPAGAAPNGGADPEGGSRSLQAALDAASRGYNDARARLAASQKRQQALAAQLREREAEVARSAQDVEALAAEAYRGGRTQMLAAALDGGSPQRVLDRLRFLERLSADHDDRVDELSRSREGLSEQKRRVDAEVRVQQAQERAMATRKRQAELALSMYARKQAADRRAQEAPASPRTATRAARSSPRAPDGTWSRESCSMDDPTSGGCLTPRTLHALQQARAAGFTRYTACFRAASFGEHPKGRACDFAAAAGGFGGTATGGDRAYGDRLASFFIANANRLAVLYVIWYRQIWMPATGWRPYSGGGSPAADHTNHVHISVQ